MVGTGLAKQTTNTLPWLGHRARMLGVLFSFLCSAVLAGEPRRVTVQPGMIELRLESVPEDSDISWDARSPIGLDFRTYEKGTVFVTARATPGQFIVQSDVIEWSAKQRTKTTWIVTVGEKPVEPIDPVDPKPIDPVKPVAPIPAPGLRVMLIFESTKLSSMPKEQREILFDSEVRDWLNQNCIVGPTNVLEWRIVDPDVPMAQNSALWQNALARPRESLPWVIISDGTKNRGFEGPLPANKTAMLELLEKFKP